MRDFSLVGRKDSQTPLACNRFAFAMRRCATHDATKKTLQTWYNANNHIIAMNRSRSRRGVVMSFYVCPASTDCDSARQTARPTPWSRTTPQRKHYKTWYGANNHVIAMNMSRSRRGVVAESRCHFACALLARIATPCDRLHGVARLHENTGKNGVGRGVAESPDSAAARICVPG